MLILCLFQNQDNLYIWFVKLKEIVKVLNSGRLGLVKFMLVLLFLDGTNLSFAMLFQLDLRRRLFLKQYFF